MKFRIYLATASLLLSPGIVKAEEFYIPVIYNLSTLYDFNPVKGNIKDLYSVGHKENGEETYRIKISATKDRCINSIELNNRDANMTISLTRDGRHLKGTKNGLPYLLQLDEHCNIVSSNDNGHMITYTTYPNGLLKSVIFLDQKISTHFYDEGFNLIKTEFYMSNMIASRNIVRYTQPTEKPLDYELINISSFSTNIKANSTCEYSEKLVPTLCNLSIQKYENPLPPLVKMRVQTNVDFY